MINLQTISRAAYEAQAFKTAAKGGGKEAPLPHSPKFLGEQVDLSDASQSMSALRRTVDAIPEVRIAVVEEMKQKIKMNGYPFETAFYKAIENIVNNNLV